MWVLVITLFLATVLVPVIFWLWFFAYRDRAEPEPKKKLAKLFFVGTGVFFLALAVETAFMFLFFPDSYQVILKKGMSGFNAQPYWQLFSIVFLAGVVEEFLKFIALYEFIYNDSDFNQIADGVFYSVTVALGFSMVENIFYFYQLFTETSTEVFAASVFARGVLTTLLHLSAAALVGYALGRKKYSLQHRKSVVLFYLLVAIVVHGLYNILSLLPYGVIFSSFLVFSVFAYILKLLRSPDARVVWKLVK